jgi:regulator of sigma E protease
VTLQGILFVALAIGVTLLVLGILVLLHELGHFVAGRLFGIRVLEFGIGFPPRAKVLHDDGETIYTVNYLPIGGFCRFEGEESDSDDSRSFSRAGLPKQLVVLAAGVTMNVLTAFVLFFIVAWLFSPGEAVKDVYISPDGAAAKAGLVDGVTIESVNGTRYGFMSSKDLFVAIRDHAGETVTIGYIDLDGQHKTAAVTLGTDTDKGILGIRACPDPEKTPNDCSFRLIITYTSTDPITAAGNAADQTWNSLQLIAGAVGDLGAHIASHPTEAPAVSGPVGITRIVGTVLTDYGLIILLLVAAVLSANLALINILPIPPFDGGKIAIQVIKRVFGVKGVTAYEIVTNLIGFVLLFVFLGWVTYFDILRMGGG